MATRNRTLDILVVGAGQAGLAPSAGEASRGADAPECPASAARNGASRLSSSGTGRPLAGLTAGYRQAS